MKEFIVVDGYNIIFAWPEFEKFRDSLLEQARAKLVSIFANYSPLAGQKVFIVFDAYQVRNNTGSAEIIDGINVLFTQQGETADALIERLVGCLLNEGVVYVATRDRAEQGLVFGRGAYRLTPDELRMLVKQAKLESESHYSRNKPADGYLEHRLLGRIRAEMEKMRREKK